MPVVDRARVVAALPSYEVGSELGSGAFGLVLAGRHRDLGRDVAIKVLSGASDLGYPVDFKGEARLLAGLDHPHIVRIYDYVESGELCLLIMELLPGGSLARRRRSISPEGACGVGLAMAEALGRAHARGVLHRDVKPDNVLFAGDGVLKVTDFGIAKIFDAAAATASKLIGTPRYMAPEQVETGRLGPPTDLYALGVILYELLSGAPPFDPTLPLMTLFHQKLGSAPPWPAGVPEVVAVVIMRALDRNPAARHPDAHAFALDLAQAAAQAHGPRWTNRCGLPLHLAEDVRDAARYPAGKSDVYYPPPAPAQPTPPSGQPQPPTGTDDPSPPSAGAALAEHYGLSDSGSSRRRLPPPSWVNGTPSRSVPAPPETHLPTPTPGPEAEAAPPESKGKASSSSPPASPTPASAASSAADTPTQITGPPLPTAVPEFPSPKSPTAGPATSLPAADTPTQISRPTRPAAEPGPAAKPTPPRPAPSWPADAPTPRPAPWPADAPTEVSRPPQPGSVSQLPPPRVPQARPSIVKSSQPPQTPAKPSEHARPAPGEGARPGTPRRRVVAAAVATVALAAAVSTAVVLLVTRAPSTVVIETVAGTGEPGFSGDGGPATAAQLKEPDDPVVAADGRVYLADTGNNRIRRIDTDGTITTIAGTGRYGFAGDRGPATRAQFGSPTGVAIDANGNVLVADKDNHRVRRINADGIITTIAGTGVRGYSGDNGPATRAELAEPTGLTVDPKGRIYVVDVLNHSIRLIDKDGTITTVAGTGTRGFSGDGGPATHAQLARPGGVAVDTDGRIYIADNDNNRIRRVGGDGIITTFAGNGTPGFSGDGGPAISAQLAEPASVVVDDEGRLYLTEIGNLRIRRIDADGTITTISGTGMRGVAGEGVPAVEAAFSKPNGLSLDGDGNLYVSDGDNNRIHVIGPLG